MFVSLRFLIGFFLLPLLVSCGLLNAPAPPTPQPKTSVKTESSPLEDREVQQVPPAPQKGTCHLQFDGLCVRLLRYGILDRVEPRTQQRWLEIQISLTRPFTLGLQIQGILLSVTGGGLSNEFLPGFPTQWSVFLQGSELVSTLPEGWTLLSEGRDGFFPIQSMEGSVRLRVDISRFREFPSVFLTLGGLRVDSRVLSCSAQADAICGVGLPNDSPPVSQDKIDALQPNEQLCIQYYPPSSPEEGIAGPCWSQR